MTGLVFRPSGDGPRQQVRELVAGQPVEALAPLSPNRYAVAVDGYIVVAGGDELLVVVLPEPRR